MMKNAIRTFLAVLMLITIAACGDSGGGRGKDAKNDTPDTTGETTTDTSTDTTSVATNLIESQLKALYETETKEMEDDADAIMRVLAAQGLANSTASRRQLHGNLVAHVKFFLNDAIQYIKEVSNSYTIDKNKVKSIVNTYKRPFIDDYISIGTQFNLDNLIMDMTGIDNEFLMVINEIALL